MHWVFNLLQRLKPVHPTASASKHETKPPGGGFENDEVEDDDDRERVNDIGGYLTAPSSMKHETEPPGGGGRGFENDDDKEDDNDC